MITTFKILAWIIFIAAHAGRDYWLIEIKHIKPIYWQSFLLRAGAATLHCFICFAIHNFWQYIDILIFQCTSFYLLFPALLNWFRGKKFLYEGAQSGWIDRFFIKNSSFFKWALLGCLIVCILSVVLIINNKTLWDYLEHL